MEGIKEKWRCGEGVALLVESNTTWGCGLRDREKAPTRQCKDCGPGHRGCRRCTTGRFRVPRTFRFRSTSHDCAAKYSAPACKLTSSSPTARSSVWIWMNPYAHRSRSAPVTPTLTAAFVELMVSGLFRAIDDRKFSAIGVLATDKRDHVFLAQAIVDHRPNVLPFTIESSLLYLHPDVRSYVRGTVVASTYSLSTRARNSRIRLSRRCLRSSSAAGRPTAPTTHWRCCSASPTTCSIIERRRSGSEPLSDEIEVLRSGSASRQRADCHHGSGRCRARTTELQLYPTRIVVPTPSPIAGNRARRVAVA